jgi:LmbE family N-acetylglucosaminyl deacetylase
MLLIVAHPDDESIGAGAILPQLRSSTFVYVTDGSPQNLADAAATGFRTRDDYAEARRKERSCALSHAGIDADQIIDLGISDQEASFHLAELSRRIAKLLARAEARWVMTHPYEGGHPDHDATAFAVHAACRMLACDGLSSPGLVELTSYHSRKGELVASEFLPAADEPIATRELNREQRDFKRRLFDCYATQHATLRWFPTDRERFRPAPSYDFTQPPHDGLLFYEQFPWGMTGERFRRLAADALRELELRPA